MNRYALKRLLLAALALALAAMAAMPPAAAGMLTIYDDALQNGFQDFSWGDVNFAADFHTHEASAATIFFRAHSFQGLSFARPAAPLYTDDFPELRFFIRGDAGGEQFNLSLQSGGTVHANVALDQFITGGAVAGGSYREVVVRFDQPPISYSGSFERINLQDSSGNPEGDAQWVYVDAVELVGGGGGGGGPLFANGFEGGGSGGDGRWVGGYYVGYERDLYPIADVDFSAITHLMVGRVRPLANATLTTDFDIDAVQGPVWAQSAIDATHAAGREAILMVGGAGEVAGWRAASTPANRPAFVANLLATMDSFEADGLDLDWEPLEPGDHANFIALVQALRSVRPDMRLTLPVGWVNTNFANPAAEAALFAALSPLLDQINVMSYEMGADFDGWHSWFASPLRGHAGNTPSSVESSVDYYLAAGVPAAKLGIGIGFYGNCFRNVSQPRVPVAAGGLVASDGLMSYRNIQASYAPLMGALNFDATAQAPWYGSATVQGPQQCRLVTFENAQSILAKAAFVADRGLGGTIIWTISQGHIAACPGGVCDPLLDAVREGFLAEQPGGPTLPPLAIERGVVVDSMSSDRFSWRDSDGEPRVAVLAHNNGQSGPSGSRGGELREYRYQAAGATRTVRSMSNGFGGFGYVVAHESNADHCTGGGDPSSLGHFTPGQFQRVFEGRHHAIFRFTQNYPRYCTSGAPAQQFNLPVTIEWQFATGRDHPLWSITWDLSGVPVNRLNDDSRAPYGEMMIDGAANAAARSFIDGVAWGDRYRFTSTTTPVTFDSEWTWNQPNTVPFVKLWTAVDATMGIVQSRPITQQDAGGYWGTADWNRSSATPGSGCVGGGYSMPCDYNWPFQSINYELYGGATRNARLAWGSNFGFLGQQSYYTHGSAFYGGPLANSTAPGHPRKNYSTHIVLDTHSSAPVEAQVAEVEALQTLVAAATVGSVATNGPAGVADATVVAYQPTGYDHVRGAIALIAAGNSVDATLGLGAGRTLHNPLLIVRNYGAATAPSSVRLGGATLVADSDYFASVRPDADELWITLARGVSGAGNRLQIAP